MRTQTNRARPSFAYSLLPDARPDHARWCWPLPALGDAPPRVLGRDDGPRGTIEVGYEQPGDGLVPVYAVHDGPLRLAAKTTRGHAATIDHGAWSTHYANLDHLMVSHASARCGRRIRAGQIIGFAHRTAPIRFELWRWNDEHGFVPTSPELQMTGWRVLSYRAPNSSGAHSTSQPLAASDTAA